MRSKRLPILIEYPYPLGRKEKDLNHPEAVIRCGDLELRLTGGGPDRGEKMSVTPSYAVNPPAIQYFKAFYTSWPPGCVMHFPLSTVDERHKQIAEDVREIVTIHDTRTIKLVPPAHLRAVLAAIPAAFKKLDALYRKRMAKA